MVLFLCGPDSFRIHERVEFLKDAFRKKFDGQGFNVSTLSGEEFTIDEFRRLTKSAGLFSQKRFVVFRNVWKLSKDDQVLLAAELSSLDDDIILCVAAEPPPRKDNALYSALLASAKTEVFEELTPGQLRTFVKQRAAQYGASIEPAAIELLITSIGNDLWSMDHELHKLANYRSDINGAAVREYAETALDENMFHLTDALGSRNVKQALRLLQQQYELGAKPQYLVAILGKQLATILKIQQTNGKGLKLHPYVIQKTREQARRFTQDQLETLFWRLLEIDQELKSTSADSKALLDLFIIEACSTQN